MVIAFLIERAIVWRRTYEEGHEMKKVLLPRRELGKTGLMVSAISAGGWLGFVRTAETGYAIDAARRLREMTAIAAMRKGIELGINYFDTAPMYQNTEAEHVLGVALNELSREERKSIVVSTKVGWQPHRKYCYGKDDVLFSFERSLKRLGYIDIVYIHDPQNHADMRTIFGKDGALDTLESLKKCNVIKAIGLGVRTHHFLHYAIHSGRFDVILPHYDYSPIRQSAEPLITVAHERGVGVVNASPYVGGLLAGCEPAIARLHRPADLESDVRRATKLYQWAHDRKVSIGALAVQFSMRNHMITTTLLGPRDSEQIEQNVMHALEPLPEGIWDELKAFTLTLGPWEEAREQAFR